MLRPMGLGEGLAGDCSSTGWGYGQKKGGWRVANRPEFLVEAEKTW